MELGSVDLCSFDYAIEEARCIVRRATKERDRAVYPADSFQPATLPWQTKETESCLSRIGL